MCMQTKPSWLLAFAWKFFNLFSARKVNPLTPRSDQHVTSLNNIHALSSNQVISEISPTYQVQDIILIENQILIANLHGNV